MPDTVSIDLLKVFQYLNQRRQYHKVYGNDAQDITSQDVEWYNGAVAAYDDAIDRLRQVLYSHSVSSEKFAAQVDNILRTEGVSDGTMVEKNL